MTSDYKDNFKIRTEYFTTTVNEVVYHFYAFHLYFKGKFLFRDTSTIDGIPMKSEAQAMNQGKLNADTLLRLKLVI